MAAVLTLVKDGYDVWGGRTKVQVAQLALDSSYPTGGYSLPATKFGFKAIWNIIVSNCGGSASGLYHYWYDVVNSKFMVFRVAGATPAGTNAASTVTGNAVVVGGGIGEAIGINPDTNAGVLSKAAATNRTIPIATFLGGSLTAPAQTFTGTAIAAAGLVEVANAVSLAAVTNIRLTALGR